MKLSTNLNGYKIETSISKNSKVTLVYKNGDLRFAGDLKDALYYAGKKD